MKLWRTLALGMAVLLTGCASLTRVEHGVQSFASWTRAVPRPLAFRFERLPSQQTDAGYQATLEQLALPALAQAGLVLDAPAAQFSLQLASQTQAESTWNPTYGPWGPRGPWLMGKGLRSPFIMPPMPTETRLYQRVLNLVLRDLATGQVVYETQAVQESRWPIGNEMVPALVTAALHGFPHPPAGPQRVTVDTAPPSVKAP